MLPRESFFANFERCPVAHAKILADRALRCEIQQVKICSNVLYTPPEELWEPKTEPVDCSAKPYYIRGRTKRVYLFLKYCWNVMGHKAPLATCNLSTNSLFVLRGIKHNARIETLHLVRSAIAHEELQSATPLAQWGYRSDEGSQGYLSSCISFI